MSDPEVSRGDLVRCHVMIGGRVQGVGFRYFARGEARRLGVAGYARNLPDGRVEMEAEGPRPAVDAFLARLRDAPAPAWVRQVDREWVAPRGGEGFRVE